MNAKKLIAVTACFLGVSIATERILMHAQAPAGAQQKQAKKGNSEYLSGPSTKELIYVTLPGTLEGSPDANGNGIVVLDAKTTTTSSRESPPGRFPPAEIPNR